MADSPNSIGIVEACAAPELFVLTAKYEASPSITRCGCVIDPFESAKITWLFGVSRVHFGCVIKQQSARGLIFRRYHRHLHWTSVHHFAKFDIILLRLAPLRQKGKEQLTQLGGHEAAIVCSFPPDHVSNGEAVGTVVGRSSLLA